MLSGVRGIQGLSSVLGSFWKRFGYFETLPSTTLLEQPLDVLKVLVHEVKVNLTESRVLNGTEGSDRIRELALTRKHLSARCGDVSSHGPASLSELLAPIAASRNASARSPMSRSRAFSFSRT